MKLLVAVLAVLLVSVIAAGEADTEEEKVGYTRAARYKNTRAELLSQVTRRAREELPVDRQLGYNTKPYSKSKGSKGCAVWDIYYKLDEFKAAFEGKDGQPVGTNGDVPIYNAATDEKIGTYDEATIAIGQKDCYFNGAYNFYFDARGRPKTQIMVSGTCFSRKQAVIGGTGKYACATGEVQLIKRGSVYRKYRKIYVCEETCDPAIEDHY